MTGLDEMWGINNFQLTVFGCAANQIKNTTDKICCHNTCATCQTDVTFQDCLTCKTLADKSLVVVTSPRGYCQCTATNKFNLAGTCTVCNSSCLTCSGASSTNCLTCQSPLVFNSSTQQCLCPTGQYRIGTTNTCGTCSTQCAKCVDSPSSSCTECKFPVLQTLSSNPGSCTCNSSVQYLQADGSCGNCSTKCATCDGPLDNNCLTCPNNQVLNAGSCGCASNQFLDGTKFCQSCSNVCGTCSGSSTNCTGCDTSLFNLVSNQCVCLDSTKFNNNGVCTNCYTSCLTCNGLNNNNCLTCKPGLSLNSGTCTCSDNTKYFDGTTCVSCSTHCSSCSGPGTNQCLTCPDTVNFILVSGTCKCFNQSQVNIGTGVCVGCSGMCLSCSGLSDSSCTSCRNDQIFDLIVGKCVCQNTTLYNDGAGACQQCSLKCLTCSGPNETDCLTCDTINFTFTAGQCTCPQNLYNFGTGVCLVCSPFCFTCSGDGSCSTCFNNMSQNADNQCICDDHSAFNNGSGGCDPCSDQCATCNGPSESDCVTCFAGQSLVQGACICTAISTFNAGSGICSSCSSKCQTCSGTSETQCLTCANTIDFYLFNGSCICLNSSKFNQGGGVCTDCSDMCQTCNGPNSNNCLSCANTSIFDLISGKCVCVNTSKFNGGGGVCTDCSDLCQECSGSASNQCTLCHDTFNFKLDGGECKCNDISKYNSGGGICQACSTKCQTCDGPLPTDCLSCYNTSDFTLISGQCLCQVSSLYNDGTGTCSPCSPYCLSCNGANSNQCLTCPTGTYLTGGGECLCNLSNQYPEPVSGSIGSVTCKNCSTQCSTCFGPSDSQCLSCSDTTNFVLLSGVCVCINALQYNQGNGICEDCSPYCLNCQGPLINDCQSCTSNIIFDLSADNQCVCKDTLKHNDGNGSCVCNSTYFEDSFGNCQKCSSICIQCNGSSEYDCLSCLNPSDQTLLPDFFDTSQTVCTCNDSNSYNHNGVCEQCNSVCDTCVESSPDSCTACKNPTDKTTIASISNASSLVFSCVCTDSTMFNDQGICTQCNQSCKTCDSGFSCSMCADGYFNKSPNFEELCEICPQGCQLCHYNFSIDKIQCDECINTDMVIATAPTDTEGSCICAKSNFYFNTEILSCEKCSEICLQCSKSASQCTQCDVDKFFVLENQTCVCELGYTLTNYDEDDDINALIQLIPSCEQTFVCDEKLGMTFDSNQICVCKTGYYSIQSSNDVFSCRKCKPGCSSCPGGICILCDQLANPSLTLDNNGNCICSVKGYYTLRNSDTVICSPCDVSCLTCQGSFTSDCLTCNEAQNFYWNENLKLCLLKCSVGTYLDTGFSTCRPCEATCKECTGPNFNNCSSCFVSENWELNQQEKTCQCQFGFDQNFDEKLKKKKCSQQQQSTSVQNLKEVGTGAVMAIAPILMANPGMLFQFLDVIELIRYFIYIDVNYPDMVWDFFSIFQAWDLQILPRLVPEDIHLMDSPKTFQKWGNDSLFIRNTEEYFMNLTMMIFFLFFIKLTFNYLKKHDLLDNLFGQVVNLIHKNMQYGVFIGFLETSMMRISIYSFLQLQNSSLFNLLDVTSYITAFLIVDLVIIFPIINYDISKKIGNQDKQFNRKYGFLSNEFSVDKQSKRAFYSCIMGKKIIICALIVFANKHVQILTFGLFATTLGLILLLYKIKPFKENKLMIRDFASEIIFTLLHFMVILLSICDQQYLNSISSQMGYAFVSLFCTVLLIQFIFLMNEQIEMIKEIWHHFIVLMKERRQQKAQSNKTFPL